MRDDFRGMAWGATALVGATAVLLVVGASVRVHGAGLACPDWPLCFGAVLPPIDFGVAFEFGHRVFAGAVSVGFAALAWAMWRRRASLGDEALRPLALAGLLLAVQVVLGGLTVLHLLASWTVASHLLVGNLFLATLAVIALGLHERVRPGRRAELGAGARALATLPVVLLPVQLVLGGLVAGTGAGLVCPSFPSCAGGAWFPSFDGLLGLQVAHRLVAWLLLISAISALVAVARDPVARPRAFLLVGAVLLQGMIGAANVLLRLPVEVTLAHTAGAALLVLVATWHAHGLAWAHVRDAIAARAGEAA